MKRTEKELAESTNDKVAVNNSGNVTVTSEIFVDLSSKNKDAVHKFLSKKYRWPKGLQDFLVSSLERVPMRFFICDDSGSMMLDDGHKVVDGKTISCTRWDEITASFKFHLELAQATGTPTEFRLLNGSDPVMIGTSTAEGDNDGIATLLSVFQQPTTGATPLCYHVIQVIDQITAAAPRLRAAGQKAAVVIATDGEPTDGNLAETMVALCDLPVCLTIRLCTDDPRVVEFWNNIDSQLEMEIDVIDDFVAEGKEVLLCNEWLNYGEPLHRLREMGVPSREMDLLDERLLLPGEMKTLCAMIFGVPASELPSPEKAWGEFIKKIKALNDQELPAWSVTDTTTSSTSFSTSPTTSPTSLGGGKPSQKWIHINKLTAIYGSSSLYSSSDGGCCLLM